MGPSFVELHELLLPPVCLSMLLAKMRTIARDMQLPLASPSPSAGDSTVIGIGSVFIEGSLGIGSKFGQQSWSPDLCSQHDTKIFFVTELQNAAG